MSLGMVDHNPSNIPDCSFTAILYTFDDNEAVIHVTLKGRSPNLKHVLRSHLVGDLNESIWTVQCFTKYVRTTHKTIG